MTVSIRRMAPAPGLALASGMLLLALAGCATTPSALPEHRAQRDRESARLAPLEAPAPALAERPRLADLQAVAERANPGVRVAFETWNAALERVASAAGLPDPELEVAAYLSAMENADGPVRGRIGLSQAFPWFGVLAASGAGALEEAEAAFEQLEVVRRGLRAELAHAWWDYGWLHQAIEVTIGHRELLRQIEAVARARYETGRLAQVDLIRIQVEIGTVEDRLATLQDRRRPLSSLIVALVGLPPVATDLPWPEEEFAVAGFPLPAAEGIANSDPRLRALDHMVRAAELGVEVARRDRWPSFKVGAEWTWLESGGFLGNVDPVAETLTFGIELPIWAAKDRARIAEAEARQRADLARRRDLEQRLDAELEDALYRYRDADRRVALYAGSLAPKAEESFRSSLTAYEGGTVPLDALIDAARLLLEFQLSSARAVADRAQALAAVERFFGPLGREE